MNDTFTADTAMIFLDDGGAQIGDYMISPIFNKGSNPDTLCGGTVCFVTAGQWGGNSALHVVDATFNGVNPDNNYIPAKDSGSNNNAVVSVYLDWTQAVTVTKASGGAVSGATVTYTDALGHTYTGTTDANGVANVAVTQKRYHNDTGASQIENRNPFSRSVTAPSCTANAASGIQVTAKGTVAVVLSGC
jgi:hypothetical protein